MNYYDKGSCFCRRDALLPRANIIQGYHRFSLTDSSKGPNFLPTRTNKLGFWFLIFGVHQLQDII